MNTQLLHGTCLSEKAKLFAINLAFGFTSSFFIWQILVEAKAVLCAGRIGMFIQWTWAGVTVNRGFGV